MYAGWNSHIDEVFRIYQKDINTLHMKFKRTQDTGIVVTVLIDVPVDMFRINREKAYTELVNIATKVFIDNCSDDKVLDNFIIWRRAFLAAIKKEEDNIIVNGGDCTDRRKEEIAHVINNIDITKSSSGSSVEIKMDENFDIFIGGWYRQAIALSGESMPVHVSVKVKVDFTPETEKEFYISLAETLLKSVKSKTNYKFQRSFNDWLNHFILKLSIVTGIKLNQNDFNI